MLHLISIGPGNLSLMTPSAQAALQSCDTIIGYTYYIDQIRPLVAENTEFVLSELGQEMARAEDAVNRACSGKTVAMISSGDIGIYAMASPIFDVLRDKGWDGTGRDGTDQNGGPEVIVHAGISAIQATAARLGAPLGHDFCTISLSDLLTPWPVIARRIEAAAWGDFVIGFYNPRSRKRNWQLDHALMVLRKHRPADTPVALARNMTRPDESITVTTLADVNPNDVDMFTLVLVGNSQSYFIGNGMATPRGYVEQNSSTSIDAPAFEANGIVPAQEQKSLYPVTLTNLTKQLVVVVGGGPVATRKASKVLDAGARIRIISPDVTKSLQRLADTDQVEWVQRSYKSGDLMGAKLAFAATNERTVNASVAQEAQMLGILCNVADAPHEGTFNVPASHEHDGLLIAVSSRVGRPGQSIEARNKIVEWMQGK